MALNHSTVVVVADDGTSPVGTNEWNADHLVSGTSLQLQYNNAGALTGMAGTSWDDTNRSLTLTGATVTTNKPILDLSQTWNASGVTFSGFKVNIGNTASAAASKAIDFAIGGTSKVIMDTGGTLAIGDTAPTPPILVAGGGLTPRLQVVAVGATAAVVAARYGATTTSARLYLNKSRNAAIGGHTVVQANDQIGIIYFEGSDGTTFQPVASIEADVDGTPGTNDMPGRLMFMTTPDGTNTNNVERMRLDSAGNLEVARTATAGVQRNIYLYNQFTDASNYERLALSWSAISNLLMLRTEAAGTGTRRDLWIQWGGQARVAADVSSNNTTTLAIATGLTVNLIAGRTYSFEVYLSFTCTAAQGIRAAMVAASSLTATNIVYDGWIVDSAANGIKGNAQATALGTVVANAATTGTAGAVLIRGTITVNAAGSLQVHFAQSVAAANNTTVRRGSYMTVQDMP